MLPQFPPSDSSNRTRYWARSLTPAMIRDLDGNIVFWNRAAEKNYGFPQDRAIGEVSHVLLHTVFPEPLAEINQQLMRTGKWEGELIHTLQDGQKVKVFSRWELARDSASAEQSAIQVVETNANFTDLSPQVAHLSKPLSLPQRTFQVLWEAKLWWLIPFIATILLFDLVIECAPLFGVIPLGE
jgi:PAS domain S-box-containing protein